MAKPREITKKGLDNLAIGAKTGLPHKPPITAFATARGVAPLTTTDYTTRLGDGPYMHDTEDTHTTTQNTKSKTLERQQCCHLTAKG